MKFSISHYHFESSSALISFFCVWLRSEIFFSHLLDLKTWNYMWHLHDAVWMQTSLWLRSSGYQRIEYYLPIMILVIYIYDILKPVHCGNIVSQKWLVFKTLCNSVLCFASEKKLEKKSRKWVGSFASKG